MGHLSDFVKIQPPYGSGSYVVLSLSGSSCSGAGHTSWHIDRVKLPDLPDCCFVVCKPDFSSSTPALYKQIDTVEIAKRPNHTAMESALLAGDLGKIAENVYNVFDPIVTADHLELNYIKSIFNSYGSVTQQMTGSGSAVFAIVSDFEFAAVICNMLKENYPQVFIAKPV